MTAKLASVFLVLPTVTVLIALFLTSLKIVDKSFATVQDIVNASTDQFQNSSAKSIFETHRMVLGNNIKNLVILIPNEGHHSPQVDEDQFIDQPFIPQNPVLNEGTNVIWLNGDVGHEHNIVVTTNSTGDTIYEPGSFPEFEVRSLVVNETGNYHYADTEEYEEGFVMTGNLEVVNQIQTLPSSTSSSSNTQSLADTVGVLMVPTQDIQVCTTDLENRGFNIDSTYNFKNLRGGQSGTGDEQTLIVWTSAGMDLSNMTANLQEFSSGLPYS